MITTQRKRGEQWKILVPNRRILVPNRRIFLVFLQNQKVFHCSFTENEPNARKCLQLASIFEWNFSRGRATALPSMAAHLQSWCDGSAKGIFTASHFAAKGLTMNSTSNFHVQLHHFYHISETHLLTCQCNGREGVRKKTMKMIWTKWAL